MITQNVDGLHTLAGSRDVIELHGDIRRARCTRCGTSVGVDGGAGVGATGPGAGFSAVDVHARPTRPIPHCLCGAMARPDVVWFGEALPAGAFERAEAAASNADVFLVAGTSAVVYPAAGLIAIAKNAGAFVVEINPEETDASSICDVSVRAKSGAFLPLVSDELERLRNRSR